MQKGQYKYIAPNTMQIIVYYGFPIFGKIDKILS